MKRARAGGLWLRWVVALVGVVLLGTGCAMPRGMAEWGEGPRGELRHTRAGVETGPTLPPPPPEEPVARGRLRHRHSERLWETEVALLSSPVAAVVVVAGQVRRVDAFEALLAFAGLDLVHEYPWRGKALGPEEAARLMGVLLGKRLTLGSYPPRQAVNHLLREVVAGGKEVGREELLKRVERYQWLAVLRPDGYLAWATNGVTQQKVQPLEWREGAFRAGNFELGRFYHSRGGVFRYADEELEPVQDPVLAEVYDDRDLLNRGTEGAVEAALELVDALGKALSSPLDTLAGLQHLPQGVAALIAAYPAYQERLQYMTRGEQMREVARLTTTLLVTVGTAGGGAGAAAKVGVSVPRLALTAEGALALELVAVPVAEGVAVLGAGAAAVAVLSHTSASSGAAALPVGGPGKWEYRREGMKDPARKYQAQISGAPENYCYVIDDVRFDGYKNGVLLEAKGPGYAKQIGNAVENGGWYEGFGGIVEQAQKQLRVARGTPIEWHFAEKEAADFVRQLFRNNKLGQIKVVYTPHAF